MATARSAPAPASGNPPFYRTPLFAALVIAAAALLAYGNSFGVPFVFDDEPAILSNPTIRSLWNAWWPPSARGETVAGRPLLNFSFAINYAVSGTNTWSYHALNLLIHVGAGAVLFGLVRRTLLGPKLAPRFGAQAFELALATATLWTLHPLQTEAVTYVVQRAESLMGLLFLLTLWCFIRACEPAAPARWRWLTVMSCLAGMAAKEVMAVAPLIVLLYDRTFIAGSFRAAWRERRGLHLGLAATWLLLGGLVLGTGARGGTFDLGDPLAWWRYNLTQLVAVMRYLRLAVWPHPLVFEYGTFWIEQPLAVAPHAIVILALVGATLVASVRWPMAGFLGIWFFVILAPSSVLPGTIQMIVEHRMYLPLVPLIVIGVLGARLALQRPIVWTSGLAMLALAFGIATFDRNRVYGSELSLWRDTVDKVPNNARARNNLGLALAKAGRLDEAMGEYRRAIAVQPNHAFAHFNLGNALVLRRQWAEAANHFRAAVAADAHYVNARVNLGQALTQLGRKAEAIEQFQAVLRDDNGAQDARTNLAALFIADGKREEGIALLRHVLAAAPELAEAHYHLGLAFEQSGRTAEAEAEFRAAVRAQPQLAAAHLALGNAVMGRGDVRTAGTSYREAIRLDPNSAEARFALGNWLAQQQQFDAAMIEFQAALTLDSAHLQARNNLANCQLVTGKLLDAIATYEEVLRQRPTDETVRQNLEVARQLWRQKPK